MAFAQGHYQVQNCSLFHVQNVPVEIYIRYNFLYQVQWDEPATILRPDRVSPWEIEPFVASASVDASQPAMKIKRPRPLDLPLNGITYFHHKSTLVSTCI